MPQVAANGLSFEYESFGDADDLILLVMGYSAQLIQWETGFCEQLAAQGFRVVRFDNRDAGLSSRCADPYLIEDWADDLGALARALAARRTHLVGLAAGGMAAMVAASRADPWVASLCVINSTPNMAETMPSEEVRALFNAPRPESRDAYIEHMVRVRRRLASPKYWDEASVRDMAGRIFDRGQDPHGMARQMRAIMKTGDLRPRLCEVRAPTLVVHGAQDPLTPPLGARLAAESIPGADLLIIGEMGHDLARPLWPRLIGAVVQNARRAA